MRGDAFESVQNAQEEFRLVRNIEDAVRRVSLAELEYVVKEALAIRFNCSLDLSRR